MLQPDAPILIVGGLDPGGPNCALVPSTGALGDLSAELDPQEMLDYLETISSVRGRLAVTFGHAGFVQRS